MMPPDVHGMPVPRFHTGWSLFLRRLRQVVAGAKYLLRKTDYPLFVLNPARGGALSAFKIARDMKLQKMVQFGDVYFSTPIMPRFPSRAYDRMVATGGLNLRAAGTLLKQQISMILLGITRRCDLRCLHCYEQHNLGSEDTVPVSRWREILRELQELGTGVVVFSGGEPMLRYEGLLELLSSGDKDLSEFHLHTSGLGVTLEKAYELRRAGLTAAAVGLDDVDPQRHDRLRGREGSHEQAVKALQYFSRVGLFTYTNMCVTRELVASGDLWRYYDMARDLHVGIIEVLEPRPCGGYATAGDDVLLTPEDRKEILDFYIKGNTTRKYRNYPLIYYVAHTEAPEYAGCMMGGLAHLTIDSRGNVNPCVFLPVSFGNIMGEDFTPIYTRMREAIPHAVHKDCPALTLAPAIQKHVRSGDGRPLPYSALAGEWDAVVKS